jgi:hypothetical protein
MNNLTKALIAAATATVFATGAAIPAQAAPFVLANISIGPDNNYWDWNGAAVNLEFEGPYNDMWLNTSGNADTWDETYPATFYSSETGGWASTIVSCADPADLSNAPDGSGDKILTCDPEVIDNGEGALSVVSEYRFSADGQTVRQRYIITNNGAAPVVGQYLEVSYNAYQDSGTNISYTDTEGVIGNFATDYGTVSDTVTNELNFVWVTDDRTDNESSPVVKYAIGRPGSASTMLVDPDNWTSGGQGDGGDNASVPYALPSIGAGQTVEYVFLVKVYLFSDDLDNDVTLNGWQEGTKSAIDLAVADTALQSDAVVFAGITDKSRVLNWSPAGLADTGVNPLPLGVGALFALAGGVAIVARRRFVK